MTTSSASTLGGSYALGAYREGRSDLDVAAVVAKTPPHQLKRALVAELRHESLPCPARGLELVLYTAAAVCRPSTEAAFELNLNTGREMPFRVDFEADPREAHWFPIDRSILAQRGIALFGPPAADVFAPIPRRLLVPLLAESLRRQAASDGRPDDVVLNACRTWMYIEEGGLGVEAGGRRLGSVEDADCCPGTGGAGRRGDSLPGRRAALRRPGSRACGD